MKQKQLLKISIIFNCFHNYIDIFQSVDCKYYVSKCNWIEISSFWVTRHFVVKSVYNISMYHICIIIYSSMLLSCTILKINSKLENLLQDLVSIVTANVLVLKHQAINSHNTSSIYFTRLDTLNRLLCTWTQLESKINYSEKNWTTLCIHQRVNTLMPGLKWPTFCRQYFEMYFMEWKSLYVDSRST